MLETRLSGKRRQLAVAAAIEIVLAMAAASVIDRGPTFPLYLGLYLAMCLPWLVACFVAVHRAPRSGSDLVLVLGVAALLRAIFLVTDPVLSDDLFRYLWDGGVQHAGINPYLFAPEDPRLAFLRADLEPVYSGINNKEIPTLYPPLMQELFYAATAVSASPVWMKTFFTLLDLALVWVLARLLAALGLNPARSLIYAWSPLPVVEIAGSGHNDVAAVLLLVGALWAFEKRRASKATALAVASALAKLGGLALVPFFARRAGLRAAAAAFAVCLLVVLPYASAGARALRGLHEYALRWRGNDSLFHLLFLATGSLDRAKLVAIALLFGIALALYWRGTPPARASFWILGAAVLLAPTAHPWYFLWIAPLLAIFPNPAWLYLEAGIALSYHAAYLATPGEPWQEVPWVKMLEYGPFFLLLLGLNLSTWAHESRKPAEDPEGRRAG
jgi:hypothetical protein